MGSESTSQDDTPDGSLLDAIARKLATLVIVPLTLVLAPHPPALIAGLSLGLLPVFLGLRALRHQTRTANAEWAEATWERLDLPAGLLLFYSALFEWGDDALACSTIIALLAVAFFGLRFAARHRPALTLLCVVAIPLVLLQVVPKVLGAAVLSAVAETHELTVDHRMKPNGVEINTDGIRFLAEAETLADDDFVILVLGDSFVFGFQLPYAQSLPYALEERLRARRCEVPVRTVNFGWTSSSPLLSLRLLREIGHRYRPDLVLYALDMTDFQDDIRYERLLRRSDDFEPDGSEVIDQIARRLAPGLFGDRPELLMRVGALWRRAPAHARQLAGLPHWKERFFVTAHPLEDTREAIEYGTARHLAAMADFTQEVLGAQLGLVLYPRAYQYSERESPENWEAGRYERLGPYVREPFRYFEEVASELSYPVLSLWSDFVDTDRFPLFFEDDPHWNADGAAFAAEALEAALLAGGMLPCR